MAGKIIEIHDPVSKDSIELTDKENKQYQGILNIALDLEEKHKKAREEIQEEYRKFLKRNEQHYKKYKELEAELKEGKITTKDFNSIDNLAYNTIQSKFIQSKDKLAAAETANNSEVEKHQKTLEEFQATVVTRHRLEKAKSEYNRIKEDIDRCKLIVATLKQQIKKPPHHITEFSLAHLQRDLKKYQYHLSLLEKRRVRRYRVYRKERPPVEEESDTEYSDGGYSSAEDLKTKECLPHRYKLTRSVKRIPHPPQPTPQPDIEPHPIEVEIDPTNPVEQIDTIPIVEPVEQERINMDQQRLEEIVREIMRRGEYNPENAGNDRGRGNGHRHRHDRDDRSLRYSMRDIPTYDGKGDAMPHTHLIEFEDFLVNTGSEINDLPQFDEPQPVDAAHYQGVIKDVVSKFKASLKGKPRLWFEMQYPTVDDEPKTVQGYKQMLSAFTTEHNPIGSTREQQIMAWKNLKWDPSKEKLDDFVYRFRRVAKELGYNADENLEVFSCCVPSHLYLYLKGATSIKEAMENIKRACALGGVSAQGPTMIETQTAPVVPFMQMNDRPTNLRTVSFKNEVAHIAPDKNDIMIDMLAKISEKLDTSASKNRSRNRERRDSRDRGSRYNRSPSYDRSSSYDRSQSRERSNSRDRSRDRSGRSKGRNQSSRERRNNSGTNSGLYCEHCKMTNHDITHCFKLQKTLKKKGIEWSEMNKKVKDDQELYQKFMKFLEIESTN